MTRPMRLSVLVITKGETPSASIPWMIFLSGFILPAEIRRAAFGENRLCRMIPALIPCEITEAAAAPTTPMPAPNIRIGSSTMLTPAPTDTAAIESAGLP